MKRLTDCIYFYSVTVCRLLALFSVSACLHAEAPVNTNPSPDFIVQTLDGQRISLSQLKDKVVVLNFWGTWCMPCKKETPDLVAIQKQFADKGVTVIGIAMDHGNEKAVKAFAKDYSVNYPIVIADTMLLHNFDVMVAPTTIIINQIGKIVFRQVGAISRQDFILRLADLL